MTPSPGAMRAPPTAAASISSRIARSPAFDDRRGAPWASRPRAAIRAKKIGLAVAGNSSRVAAMAGLRLPIESHVLQAFVSEG
jgi:glycine/D-amino acid oxidase-like deaminating enzyme